MNGRQSWSSETERSWPPPLKPRPTAHRGAGIDGSRADGRRRRPGASGDDSPCDRRRSLARSGTRSPEGAVPAEPTRRFRASRSAAARRVATPLPTRTSVNPVRHLCPEQRPIGIELRAARDDLGLEQHPPLQRCGSQKWEPTWSAALRRSTTRSDSSRRSMARSSTQSDGGRQPKRLRNSLTRKRSLVQIQYGPPRQIPSRRPRCVLLAVHSRPTPGRGYSAATPDVTMTTWPMRSRMGKVQGAPPFPGARKSWVASGCVKAVCDGRATATGERAWSTHKRKWS